MKNYIVKKNTKKVKLILTSKIKNNIKYKNEKLFIETKYINFFINKVNKLIKSVTTGWFLELNLNGLGYKSFKLNDKIALDLGYSNLIIYKPDSRIKVKNFKNKLVLFSIDQEYLNNVGLNLRNYSKPDSYKGKGILLKNETIKLKKKAKT